MSLYRSLPQHSVKESQAMEEDEGEEEKQDTQAESTEPAADEPGTSAGSGRFYDCIFCKRGFTTAQALGGHMNIHRKDRARLGPTGPSSSSPKRGERAYHPYPRPQSGPVSKQTVDQSYVVYFPVSSGEGSVTELVQGGEELQLGLGRSGPKEKEKVEEGEGKKKEVVVEEDLDLELRLGQRKSHDSSSSDL